MKYKHFTKKDISFIKSNYPHKGAKFCSDQLGRTENSIRYKASKLGIKSNKRPPNAQPKHKKHMSDYNVNPNIFISNFTKESSYILGFLWADGNLSKNNTIRTETTKEDNNDIFPIFLKTGNWAVYNRNRPNRKPQSIIHTTNKHIHEFLTYHNYGPNNSNSACSIVSLLPDNLQKYWFRGLIDGDGCWYISPQKYCQFILSGRFDQNWLFFENLLEYLNIKYSKYIKQKSKHKYSCIRITNRHDVISLGDFIYGKNYDKIGIYRKYTKYKTIKKLL